MNGVRRHLRPLARLGLFTDDRCVQMAARRSAGEGQPGDRPTDMAQMEGVIGASCGGAAGRAVEGGRAEAEDAPVGGDQPVATVTSAAALAPPKYWSPGHEAWMVSVPGLLGTQETEQELGPPGSSSTGVQAPIVPEAPVKVTVRSVTPGTSVAVRFTAVPTPMVLGLGESDSEGCTVAAE